MNRNKKISLIGLAMALMLIFNLLLPPQFSFATDASPSVTLSENSGTIGTGDAGSTTPIGSPSPTTDNAVGDAQTSDNSAPTTNNDNIDANNFGDAPPIAVNLQNNGTNTTGKTWDNEAILENTLKVATAESNKTIYAGSAVAFNLTFKLKTNSTLSDAARVRPGDKVKLLLSRDFSPSDIPSEQEKKIYINGKLVGNAVFSTETGNLFVTLSFSDNADFGDGSSDIGIEITATLKYSNISITSQTEADLAGTKFQILPKQIISYPMTKSGRILPNGNIEWTILVESTKDGSENSLLGTKLVDDLSEVGSYVVGSFKLNDTPITNGFSYSNKTIEYEFGDVKGQQKITFETTINDYFTELPIKSINNKAVLQYSFGTTITEKEYTLLIPKREWIKKEGRDLGNKRIQWSIVINEPKANLGNIEFKDYLSYGHSFVSGSYTVGNSSESHDITQQLKKQSEKKIIIPDVSDTIQMTITTEYTQGGNYTNTAEIFTADVPNFPGHQAVANVKIGNIGFDKEMIPLDEKSKPHPYDNKGIKFDADLREGTLQWQITVDDANLTNHYVYDLLWYGNKALPIDNFSEVNSVFKIQGSFGMKYHSGLREDNVIKLLSNGKAVADLIKIPLDQVPSENGKKIITYRTKVLDREATLLTWGKKISNIAFLFNGEDPVAFSQDSGDYQNSTLYKSVLDPDNSSAEKLDLNIQQYYAGYNYNNREILYRLSINASNADFSKYEYEDGKLPPVIVEDQLPDELEFSNFEGDNVPFKIFESDRNVGGIDSAVPINKQVALSNVEMTAQGIRVEKGISGSNNIRFIFEKLDRPYVIILKTKYNEQHFKRQLSSWSNEGNIPSDSYMKINNNAFFYATENQASLKADTIKTKDSLETRIFPTLFTKKVEAVDGMLRWKIEYKPYLAAAAQDIFITDTLPSAVELPLGIDGEPVVSFNPNETDNTKIKITSQSIRTEYGYYAYSNDAQTEHLTVKYDKDKRELTFIPKDKSKGYIIEYFTPYSSEAKAGVSITNKATLWVDKSEYRTKSATKKIEDQFSISAWLSQIGGVQITKVDADEPSKKLSGAVFVLKDKQNHIVKKGATNEKGELVFAPLGIGEYTLEEETAPNGYTKSADVYRVIVSKNEQGTGKKTVVKKVENNTETALSEPLIEVGNKKIPPSGGGTNQGGGNVPKDPQTPPSTPPSTGGSGGGTPNNQSSVRPDPSTPAKNKDKDPTEPGKKSEDKKTEEKPDPTPEPAPIPVNTDPNPSNENPPQNPNSNSSIGSPSGSGSGGRRIIGYTPTGEPIYDDATPFGNREKVEQATKSKQGKNDPSRIASAPRTGAGQISLSSMGLAWGSFISLIIALCDRSLSKKRINK